MLFTFVISLHGFMKNFVASSIMYILYISSDCQFHKKSSCLVLSMLANLFRWSSISYDFMSFGKCWTSTMQMLIRIVLHILDGPSGEWFVVMCCLGDYSNRGAEGESNVWSECNAHVPIRQKTQNSPICRRRSRDCRWKADLFEGVTFDGFQFFAKIDACSCGIALHSIYLGMAIW